jgi:diguanylate cyclase (GGDEF)-like protein
MSNNMDDLHTELRVLQSHVDSLMGCIKQNETKLHRFQLLETNLLTLNSLYELIEHVLDDTQTVFDLDFVSFCLVDEKGEIRAVLEEEGLSIDKTAGLVLVNQVQPFEKQFGKVGRHYLGDYNKKRCEPFFSTITDDAPASVAIMPLMRRGKYLGALSLGSLDKERFSMQMATDFLRRLSDILSVCLENTLNFEMLKRTSFIDPLTGINNRRFFDQRIGEEIDRAQRSDDPLSCLFLDIDYFKKVNDQYGHQAGDCILVESSAEIKKQLRNNDILARYGGEEFVVLLSNAPNSKAVEVAERIRSAIETQTFDCTPELKLKITISIGISTYNPNAQDEPLSITPSQLIELADQGLYAAKDAGRNQVSNRGEFLDKQALKKA